MKVIRHQRVRMDIQLMTKRRIPQCEKEEQVVLFGAEDVTSVGSTIDDVMRQIGELDAVSACHADTQCMNRIRPRHSGFPHDLRNGAFRSCRNCDPRRPPSSHFDHCGGRAGAGQGQGRGRPGAGPGFTGFTGQAPASMQRSGSRRRTRECLGGHVCGGHESSAGRRQRCGKRAPRMWTYLLVG